ncbi:MAG TPA: PilZ domain-containing protein [Methylomirabilota bacterium]|nr:PilZ domain-containing protein [Methylomirabilota bacterium]
MSQPAAELRRYPRARVAWRVIVEVPGGRPVTRETVDFGPWGAKVRIEERLDAGTSARLRFAAPDRRPLEIYAVVRRSDADGPVFGFVGLTQSDLLRLKALVDSQRRL